MVITVVADKSTASSRGNTALIRIISQEIAAHDGSIPFSRFMELALYHPRYGYYMSSERRPGRGGDFITSPEASPLFGHALARQMVEFWERLGRPGHWTIREYGAGIGGLAYDILAGIDRESAAAFDAVTYRLAELNSAMRNEAMESMHQVGLVDKVLAEDPDADLPAIEGVVLANEVADAFPAIRIYREGSGWREAHVASGREGFVWADRPLSPAGEGVLDALEREDINLPDRAIVDAAPSAAAWFERAVSTLNRGYAMVIDYGYAARMLYRDHRLGGTIRGYQGHTVTDDPLIRVGEQDLTAHVDFTALQRAGERQGMFLEGMTTQGAMLSSLDLGQALAELQADPETTTQEYLATQAVVLRLIDPGGLGRFSVLTMRKGLEPAPEQLRMFRDAPPSF